MKIDVEKVWVRIKNHEGEKFETKTGKPFIYEIVNNSLIPDRTNYPLARNQFEKAIKHLPLQGPGEISSIVRGSAYVWAILHDRRIRKNDW